jgi:hypothetical protein
MHLRFEYLAGSIGSWHSHVHGSKRRRRFGRFTVRLAMEAFKEAIDDLARYVLGVDEDFQKLIIKA